MPSARWYQVQGSHVPGTGYLVLGNMYQLPGTFQAGRLATIQALGVPDPWHKVPKTAPAVPYTSFVTPARCNLVGARYYEPIPDTRYLQC